MFIIHLVLLVTGRASIRCRVAAGMARSTIAICPFMVSRERMVKRRVAEIGRVGMAVTARPLIMVGRR